MEYSKLAELVTIQSGQSQSDPHGSGVIALERMQQGESIHDPTVALTSSRVLALDRFEDTEYYIKCGDQVFVLRDDEAKLRSVTWCE